METEMLDSSKKEERAMEEEKADRGLVEEEKKGILGKEEKEAKLVEQCFICDAPAVFNCPACSQVPICEHHQDYHQDPISGQCFPFTVSKVDGMGRVLIAATDFQPGDFIFREKELVVGPSKSTPPVCLGCGRRVSGAVRCPGCSWPLCSLSCPKLESQHSAEECKAIAPTGPDIPDCKSKEAPDCLPYWAILVLRVAVLPPADLDYMLQFMDHNQDRDMEGVEEQVVKRIREDWGQTQLSEDLLRRIDGILDVNSVEHRVVDSPSSRCFLPITSLASHSCTSNSFKDKTEDGWVVTRAKTKVLAGEQLTFHYQGGLKGRLMRGKVLKGGWYFDCACDRCASPTEMGAELSSHVCSCGGVVRCLQPLDINASYGCDRCHSEKSVKEIFEVEKQLTEMIEATYSTDTSKLQQILETSTDQLHPTHFLVLILKWLLITSWGRLPGHMHKDLDEKTLERKISLCREYLRVLDVIDAGISHNIGITAWELQSAQMFLLNKRFREERVSPIVFIDGLKECRSLCRTAIQSLRFYSEEEQDRERLEMALKSEAGIEQALTFFTQQLGI